MACFSILIGPDRACQRNRHSPARFVGAAHRNKIADAAFNDLHFDRRHPATFVAAILAVAVDQASRIAHRILAMLPCSLAKLEFEHEMIIAIALIRDEATETVAADVNHSIGDGEHLRRSSRLGSLSHM